MTIRPKTKSCRVTCNWNCKALQHVQNAQWPRETCNYLQYCPRQRVVDLPVAVTVRPCCSKCTVTKRDMQLSMTIRPKTKSCSCDCKALMLFRIHRDQKRQLWQYGLRQTGVELPVTVRHWCYSEYTVTKRDSYDSTARDSCRVTCDSKALMLFRMQADQKRQLWQYMAQDKQL